jgi:aconitate hydratase
VPLADVPASFRATYPQRDTANGKVVHDGSVVIAAITSCTNTSNPSVMVAAGLLARNAVARGLRAAPHVKTSLAPGSRVVTDYLAAAGLQEPLDALGFQLVGYGCTTCIGNSGPLSDEVSAAVRDDELAVCAVLSGNRNFEGRIHPLVRASYLASPPLVVAYALAGSIDVDLEHDPLGTDSEGADVFLHDLWPSSGEVRAAVEASLSPELFERQYAGIWEGDERWQALPAPEGALFAWDPASTYVREPSFFQSLEPEPTPLADIVDARCLVMLGDSVTTDHISPAGAIPRDMPAGQYLTAHGVEPRDFNSFGARRGNHEVMVRGTFGNIRLRNALARGREGGFTEHVPSGDPLTIFEAAERYAREGVPLVALVGKEYGSGSSRDWAAKGTLLLGIRAVIAESYERIHRSNLVGMGVLPLEYAGGETAASLGLDGRERFTIRGIAGGVEPHQRLTVEAAADDGATKVFEVLARVDSPADAEYLRHGGILPLVLRRMIAAA